jgi:hypothetical protein
MKIVKILLTLMAFCLCSAAFAESPYRGDRRQRELRRHRGRSAHARHEFRHLGRSGECHRLVSRGEHRVAFPAAAGRGGHWLGQQRVHHDCRRRQRRGHRGCQHHMGFRDSGLPS